MQQITLIGQMIGQA